MNRPRLRSIAGKPKPRKVFSSRRSRPSIPVWRQALEGVLLVMLGVGLLAFLSWLPQKIDALVVVSEAIADLIRGLAQLLEALLGIAAVILLALLLVAALVALLGGVVRLTRACWRSFSSSSGSGRVKARPGSGPSPRSRSAQR